MEVDECMPCTAGYYCNDFALTAPSGPCLAGYYCPTGSDLETEVIMHDMIVQCVAVFFFVCISTTRNVVVPVAHAIYVYICMYS